MADSFFGFDTSLTGLEDALNEPLDDDELGEEEEYDALNDETFGSEATMGDWEQDHEKLSQITESTRPYHQNATNNNRDHEVDIEDSLSHLVLDDKEGITPRPGVWDCPINLPSLNSRPLTSLLPSTIKNIRTVEELELGLMSRPPPGLTKPMQQQQPHPPKLEGNFIFDTLALKEQQQLQHNGLTTPRFPPGLGPPVVMPNMRLPPHPSHPSFLQNSRLLPNQSGNMLRYPLPPHLLMQQRQPLHGAFVGNFPQPPPHPNLAPPQFLHHDRSIVSSFPNNHVNQQHHLPPPHPGNQQQNQNRQFHHNEQQPPLPPPSLQQHQPFFKDNQQYQNRNNQRHHQQPHYNQERNGVNSSGEYDEYAGLMSNREKQWLINIQLLQHNANQSYIDDYYYTVYSEKQEKQNEKRENNNRDKKSRNSNGYHRDSREKEPQHTLTKVVYTPMQFENSLGKLQCGSVTAPRKIIDMDVVQNNDVQAAVSHQKDTKKTRQLLLEIERLYSLQLKLEDTSNPLAILAEQQQLLQQQQQAEQNQDNENEGEEKPKPPPKKTAPELIAMMVIGFQQVIQDDKLTSLLSIRKGKTLLLRFLPRLNVIQYDSLLREIWIGLLRGLAIIGRRDSHMLINFYGEFKNWLRAVKNFATLNCLARALTEVHQSRSSNLPFALTNKFGVSVIALLLEKAEELFPPDNGSAVSEWSTFITNMVETVGTTPPSVSPCQPIAHKTLKQHLNRIHSLKTERYAPLELLLTDTNPSLSR